MRQTKIGRPSKAATSRDEGRAAFVAESGQIPGAFLVASGMRYKLLKTRCSLRVSWAVTRAPCSSRRPFPDFFERGNGAQLGAEPREPFYLRGLLANATQL